MAVVFENKEVADKYEACRESDGKVHIPAGKKTATNPIPTGFAGPLSKISLAAADKAFAGGSNILKLKEAAKQNFKKADEKKDDKPVVT